jgi:hypothetical protein
MGAESALPNGHAADKTPKPNGKRELKILMLHGEPPQLSLYSMHVMGYWCEASYSSRDSYSRPLSLPYHDG